MNGNRTDVVVVRFELMDSFESVVVVDANEHIILDEEEVRGLRYETNAAYRGSEDPVLSNHEFPRANWHITDFECFQQLLEKRTASR